MEKDKINSTSSKNVKAVPDGFHTVTPFIIVNHADMLIEFIKAAFDGEVTSLMKGEDEKIMHATVRIGDSTIMLSDSSEQYGPMPCMLYLYVEDADQAFTRAVSAGAKADMPVADMFWGDRCGQLTDPFGHKWNLATHKENLTPEEMRKRSGEFFAQMAMQAR